MSGVLHLRSFVLAGCLSLTILSCDRAAPPPASPAPANAPSTDPTPPPDPPVAGDAPAVTDQSVPSVAGDALSEILADIIPRMNAIPIGHGTVADLALPEDFQHRLAIRTFLDTYRAQIHVVDVDPPTEPPPVDRPPVRSAGRPGSSGQLAIRYSLSIGAAPGSHNVSRPARRGFRAGLPGEAPNLPFSLPSDSRAEANLIARNLASQGLARTLALWLNLNPQGTPTDAVMLGFPIDLLAGFDPAGDAEAGFRRIAGLVAELPTGPDAEAWRELLDRLVSMPWTPRPTHGFRVDADSGNTPIEHLRLQLTRGTPWQDDPDAGDSLAVARQVLDAAPDATAEIVLEADFVEPFLETYRHWSAPTASRTLVAVNQPVAQWAQDNARPGQVNGRRANLLPRYASRRDDGSLYIPGESALTQMLSPTAVRSMLLFQGGNILVSMHPTTGERLAIIGEAEVVRNLALGLTHEQVVRAFAVELDVDRTIVVPALSFHVDYDVSVRAVGDELVAFVNDPVAAATIILSCAIDPLAAAGRLTPEVAAIVRQALIDDNLVAAHQTLHQAVDGGRLPNFFVRLSLANQFALGGGDNGVGNLQRFLLALDLIGADRRSTTRWPEAQLESAVHAALREQAAARARLESDLATAGFRVVQVPSIAAGVRSVNLINAVHGPRRILIPAWGGLFAPVDEAATAVFAATIGPDVSIHPIRGSESQRRSGAVHCATTTYRTP